MSEFAPGDEVLGYLYNDILHAGTYAEKVAGPASRFGRQAVLEILDRGLKWLVTDMNGTGEGMIWDRRGEEIMRDLTFAEED